MCAWLGTSSSDGGSTSSGKEWGEDRAFPKHETAELPYRFDAATQAFHDAVLDWCLGIVQGAGEGARVARLAFWGVLALMRCVGSSPAAAASALRNRLAADPDRLAEQVFDDDGDDADAVDLEPASGLEDPALAALAAQAEGLAGLHDPKLSALVKLLKAPLAEGANPVVFCRFLATADHVAAGLRKAYPKLRIEAVTGAVTPEERRARVEAMGEAAEGQDAPQRLLVATDCLSEGINLQALFDMVVHYDLSWNPTRHQQREGRVDRFGQPKDRVRSVLMFSPDSAIDGAVLDVILRKAERIRTRTGVTVPLPDERGAVTGALMNRVLLRKGRATAARSRLRFPGGRSGRWRRAGQTRRKAKSARARASHKTQLSPRKWLRNGSDGAMCWADRARCGVSSTGPFGARRRRSSIRRDGSADAHLEALPDSSKERLLGRGLSGTVRISFDGARPGAALVTRSHPLPATLADSLLEGALDQSFEPTAPLGRAGAWPTRVVATVTTVAAATSSLQAHCPSAS